MGRDGDDALVHMGRVMERAAAEIGIERRGRGMMLRGLLLLSAEFEMEAVRRQGEAGRRREV